jgi:ABC-type multidrug transport system fused ATPase/permease subunit
MREAWDLYKAHWRHLLVITVVVFLLLSLFTVLLVVLLGRLGLLASALVSLAGIFWLQGALVIAVEDIRDGRADLSTGETLSRVRPRLNTLSIAGILAALGILAGLVLFIVPGLVLATWWMLIVPVIMLEGAGVVRAFGRSRELVRGHAWSAFGVVALTFLVVAVVGVVIGAAVSPLRNEIESYVRDVVRNTLTAPFVALAFTLAYYRLRALAERGGDSGVSPAAEGSTLDA